MPWVGRMETIMPFQDRTDAGRKLAEALGRYKDQEPVILALPRGGVPVAAEVAAALKAPLDLIMVRKIGVPFEPELAMGAVADGGTPIVIRNESVIQSAGIDGAGFKAACDTELAEIERRRTLYLGTRERLSITGRIVLIVDDGIATGATTRAALRAARLRNPKRLILAVPVAPSETLAEMREEADEVVCLEKHKFFGAIGFYYQNFRQVSDREVIELLTRFSPKAEQKQMHPPSA